MISLEAAARRDTYRQHGRFGVQPAADAGLVTNQTDTDDDWVTVPGMDYGVLSGVAVRYNAAGAATVRADVAFAGDLEFHAERHFRLDQFGDWALPSGQTRREAVEEWMDTYGGPFLADKMSDRYGCHVDPAAPGLAQFHWASPVPGGLSDEEVGVAAGNMTVRFQNESSPNSGSEYPYDMWLSEAVATHGHPYGSVDWPAA